MSNHSVIEHRANYHFLKVEEDYVHICGKSENSQYPQCKAVILSILEHWINDKRSKGLDEYVYMTYPEWIDNMYGFFRRSTIIACLTDLEHDGLISRRPCKRHGKDTYEYTLNVATVQEKLKQLPERTDKYTRPNLNASKFKRVQKQTRLKVDDDTDTNLDGTEHEDPSKSKRNIDTITYTPSNIDSDRSLSGESDAPAPISFSEEKKKRTDPRIPVVSSHSQVDIGNEETVKMPAVKPSQQKPDAGTRALAVSPPHGGQDDSTSVQALSGSPSRDPAQRTIVGANGAVQASGRKKVTQAKLKSPEELEQDERCRALQQRINEWRGYPLEVKGQIINERKCIRTLVERYSDEQIEQFYLYLFNRHWKWSKPDNRYHIGAYVILSEAQSIEQELKAKPKQNGKAPGKPDAYGNDYSLTSLIARQQKAM